MNELFNSPVELGVRMVYLLMALYPKKVDIQRLVYFDYAAIYSSDLGGPESLHTPVPLRGGEFASRRAVIEEGLYLMVSHSLIDIEVGDSGIEYILGDNGPSLIGLLGGEYPSTLLNRCKWVAENLGQKDTKSIEDIFLRQGVLWGAEFVAMEMRGE